MPHPCLRELGQQTLLTELKSEEWFSMLSPPQQNVTVASGGDANGVFTFKAIARANPGKQRVTARNSETRDAVEREVQVHPDGQEISFTTADSSPARIRRLRFKFRPQRFPVLWTQNCAFTRISLRTFSMP